MGKRLIIALAFALVVGISFAAYAEVQNVKVSGDLTIAGVYRSNFDLAKSRYLNVPIGTARATTYDDTEKDMFSIARVRIDADLTDNVSATVRLLNERNWNGESIEGLSESNRNIGLATANPTTDQRVDLDLAYVTLKEFLYSPLTVTVGRQELHFGNDFVIGDPDTNGLALRSALAEGDLSARKSFDAVRATLDYNPLVVDIIYSKIAENNSVVNDDATLAGLNARYDLDKNTSLEGYFFSKMRGSNATAATRVDSTAAAQVALMRGVEKDKMDVVNTVGARVVNKTVKNLTLDAQAGFQFGTYNPKFDPNARWDSGFAAGGNAGDHAALVSPRRAWATEIIASYDLKDISMISKYSPMFRAAYLYLSGESRDKVGDKAYKGWDPMFENQSFGHIINAIMGYTNVTGGMLTFQAKPMDDITVKADYVRAYFNKRHPEGRATILSGVSGAQQFIMGKDRYLGQEIDMTLTYDYTEDVQFCLLGGYFLPGKSINIQGNESGATPNTNPRRAAATELIGSMKVMF